MKLHLPKMLLTAVLAVVGMGYAQAMSITGTGNLVDYTIDATKSYAGYNVTYSVADGLGTISGLNINNVVYTFTFDVETAKETADAALMYVANGSKNENDRAEWGLHVYNGDIVSHWWVSSDTDGMFKETETKSSLDNLNGNTVTAWILQKNVTVAENTTKSGVYLYSGSSTTSDPFFQRTDLYTSTGSIENAYFNTSLVETITVKEYENLQVTAGDVSKTLNLANTAVFGGTGKHEVVAGDARLANGAAGDGNVVKKNIVVSGTSQLFLNSWADNSKALDVDRDIYIGSTTYSETGYGAQYNNAALRFGNNGVSATNLKGNTYIMEDAILVSGGEKAINFEGNVTDVIDGTATGSALTLKGKGYVFKGAVNLSGLVLQSGSAATFSSASATIGALTTGGTVTNTGSLAVTGTLNLQNAIANSGSLNLNDATIEIGGHTSLFSKAENDVAGNGFLTGGTATVYTNSGDSVSVSAEIAGVTVSGGTIASDKYTLSDGVLTVNDSDNTTYWIFNDTDYSKISSAVSGDENANKTVRVTAGKTYDIKGSAAYNKVVLESGATLANTGNNIGSESVEGTTYNYCNEKQNYYIELAGDANMSATGSYAMVAGNHECSTLKLNGHTLTKKGTGTVVLNSTVADAGTIAITAGKIWLNEHNDAKKSDLDEVAFTMSSGTTLRSIDSMTIKSLSSSGGSITVDSGKKLTVTGALALGAGTSQLSGSLKAADMTVTDGGKLSMTTGSVLDLTGKFAELSVKNGGNNTRFNDLITLVNNVTTNGTSYVLVNGISVTNEAAGDDQSVVGNINMQNNATLNSNLTFTNNLNINGKGWSGTNADHPGYDFTVANGATLKVGESGTGQLALITQADLIISNGSVTAGLVKLGHTDGSTSNLYEGTIKLNHADSKLTAQKIQFQGANAHNALTMTAGTLEFTGDGAVFTGNNNNAVGNVSISGGEVVVNKNQSMDTVSGKRGVALSNMKFNIAADKSMSLDSGVTISNDVTVKGSGTLKFAGSNDLSSMGGTVKVTESAKVQYQNDAVQVAAKSAEGTASVTSAAIADAAVTVGGTADVTLAQALSNADLSYTGANKLMVTGTGSSLSSLTAQGNVDIMSAAAAQQLNAITIGAGKTVGIYTGDVAEAITSSESTITTGSLTAGVDSVLNANLVLSDGATVTMADALTMGSDLRLGEGMTLSGDLVNTIKSMSEDGIVDLFTGVDALYLGDSTTVSGALDATSGVNLSMYFNFEGASNYYLGYADKKVFAGIQSVPEPTTATLSLLALAGLAARRRRK